MERVVFSIIAFVEHNGRGAFRCRHLRQRGVASRNLIPLLWFVTDHELNEHILHVLHLVFQKGLRSGVLHRLLCAPFD